MCIRDRYKLIGFIMMFCSSSLMGGIGAFTRFIDAPGDFVSFWRNFAGLIAVSYTHLERANDCGASILNPYMSAYPRRLLLNKRYPPILFCRGCLLYTSRCV